MKQALVGAILLLTLAFAGCRNGCADVTCLNGGSCKDGECECTYRYGGRYCDTFCAAGYEGLNCSVASRQKYLRQWNATTRSTLGVTVKHTLNIAPAGNINNFYIINFNNEGYTIIATVSASTTFDIYPQNASGSYTGKVSGSGHIEGNRLSINLTKQGGPDYFADCNP